jgi:hypothetical protein
VSLTASPDALRLLERNLDTLESQFEELESEASLVAAFDLLDGIEQARLEVAAGAKVRGAPDDVTAPSPLLPIGGDLICYWPGRSMSTGEPNVASRGFFDGLDRPPLGFWLEAIARPCGSTREEFEMAIIAWVPADDLSHARAGCRVCTSGSLELLSDVSTELTRQLSSILDGRASQ